MLRFIAILLLSGNLLALCVKPIFTPKIINPNLTKADISATSTQLNDNLYNLSGGVEINTNKYYLTADEVVIDNQTKNYKVSGNIKMQVANLLATSDKLSVDNSAGVQLSANNLTYNYLVNNIKGNATQVSVNNGKEILTNASYSSCALESPKWQLRAENITLNKAENLGEAENVSFEFFGMPLFWLPKYQWVLEGRQSGLLAPEFSSYSIGDEDGYSLSVPYYFNLATEKDLTLTLNNLSTRGQVLKTQYRHLLAATKERGYLEINAVVSSVKEAKNKNPVVIFQPHRYSRTKELLPEFIEVLKQIDKLIILPIYPAGEVPIQNINSQNIINQIGKGCVVDNFAQAINILDEIAENNDIVLTLGAGDITKFASQIVEKYAT
jgi:lipopolysaccharide export system protein LptA